MFFAVGWNVHHNTPKDELANDLEWLEEIWPRLQIIILQELKPAKGHDDVFRQGGYQIKTAKPEYGIATDPIRFKFLRKRRLRVGDLTYWTVPYLFVCWYKDRATGKIIKVITCHPPAHVQRKDANEKWPNVRKVARDTYGLIQKLSIRPARRKNIVVLAEGDLNIDINGKNAKPFRYWLRGVPVWLWTGTNTHGGREIDVFGTEGLTPVGKLRSTFTYGDHKAIGRFFQYEK